jgi:hypothetical protein
MSRLPGCYGFRLSGLTDARNLLVDAPRDWPALELRSAPPDGQAPTADAIGPDRAHLVLRRGWVEIDRRAGVVTFRIAPRPPDHDLVHPLLPARPRSLHAGPDTTASTPAPW